MDNILRVELIALVIIIGILVILTLRAQRITIKYSIVWLLFVLGMLAGLLVPDLFNSISMFLGFEVLSNMIFLIGILVLFCLSFFLTVVVSKQNDKIRLLIQETSILKSKINNSNGRYEKK